MSDIINLNARLAALEARRQGQRPGQRRMAEVMQRLVARVDATRDLEDLLAFRAEVAAARRSAGQ